jgi:hypothetical protein
MIHYVVNWLVWSFINGLVFFLIFLALFYWLYIKDLPVARPPSYAQFEKFQLNDVSFFTLQPSSISDLRLFHVSNRP